MQFLQVLDLVRDNSESNPELSSLLEDIDPKPSQTVDLITHVHFPILDESFLLPIVHQTESHLRQVIMIEGLQLIPRSQGAIDPEDRGSSLLDMNVGGFLGKGFQKDLI
jgi:hypothetical protein